MSTCPYNKILGIECPGCGMQRAFIALLRGELLASLQLFPALLPMLALIVLVVFHLKFKFEWGAKIIKWLFFICVGIIIFSYIYKISS
ncbi:MAG: DUF2752 domain-containing protein [Marinifilaceae bacterium]